MTDDLSYRRAIVDEVLPSMSDDDDRIVSDDVMPQFRIRGSSGYSHNGHIPRSLRTIRIDNCTIDSTDISYCHISNGLELYNSDIDRMTMDNVELQHADFNRGDINNLYMVNVRCSSMFKIGCRCTTIGIVNSAFSIADIRPEPGVTELRMSGVRGYIGVIGDFSTIAVMNSDFRSSSLNGATGRIVNATGTLGDGTYIKTIVHGETIYTYTHDKLWVANPDFEHTVSIEDLSLGDNSLMRNDLNIANIANIIDMILDDPAEPLPVRRTAPYGDD